MVLMRLNRDRILGKDKLIGPIKALGANRLDKSDGHAAAGTDTGDATLYPRRLSVAREAGTVILALLVVPVFR